MPRPKSPHKTSRLNLDLHINSRELLEQQQVRMDADSLKEVIQENARIVQAVIEWLDDGFEIMAVKDGRRILLKSLLLMPKPEISKDEQ